MGYQVFGLTIYTPFCPNMARIDLQKLCYTLEHPGQVNVVRVKPEIAEQAHKALERMLALQD